MLHLILGPAAEVVLALLFSLTHNLTLFPNSLFFPSVCSKETANIVFQLLMSVKESMH